jgi:hypothetical protein
LLLPYLGKDAMGFLEKYDLTKPWIPFSATAKKHKVRFAIGVGYSVGASPHLTPSRVVAGCAVGCSFSKRKLEQTDDCLLNIRLAHQRLTDQHGLNVGRMNLMNIRCSKNTAFSDNDYVVRDMASQSNDVFQIDGKCMKISIVDSDQLGSGVPMFTINGSPDFPAAPIMSA